MRGYLCILLTVVSAVFFAADAGRNHPECEVSDWQPWSACSTHYSCQNEAGTLRTFTYPLPAVTEDAGRAHMDMLRYAKSKAWEETRACINDGTCPEFNQRPSTGQVQCVDGNAGDYQCRNTHVLSFLNFEDLGYGIPHPTDSNPMSNDIWGWTDPETQDEYAIICLSGATSFVRITDPVAPKTLAIMYTQTVATMWRDAKTIGNYVYIVSEASDHGLQIYDLTQLRDMDGDVIKTVQPTRTYHRFGNAHNIVANEETGFLYVVGARYGDYGVGLCEGGLHMIDVREPSNPKFAGCYGGDGYTHDAECVVYRGPDISYFGHEICFAYNEDSLTILDVTDHFNIKLLSKKGYSTYAYTHQGWLTHDHTTLLLDDELDEFLRSKVGTTHTYVWDVRSLRNPEMKSIFKSTESAIDHNMYIHNNLIFQANYEAGLRILYLDQDSYELREVGYFDCLPSSTKISLFQGSWSNYPYYSSGTVVLSSIDYGLFVLKPDTDAIWKEIRNNKTGQRSRSRTIIKADKGAKCPALVETEQCESPRC